MTPHKSKFTAIRAHSLNNVEITGNVFYYPDGADVTGMDVSDCKGTRFANNQLRPRQTLGAHALYVIDKAVKAAVFKR